MLGRRYRIWIHRTRVLLPQLFLQRLTLACIWSDCISGIIVTAAIILSFLSLMTFADFLADQLLRFTFSFLFLFLLHALLDLLLYDGLIYFVFVMR